MRPVTAFLDIARSEGIDRIFGNPGTTELPLIEALTDQADIDYVLGLHEGSVVAMADGFARANGRPSLVNLHVAAGVANGLLGMLNASRSRTPMVITAGQQDRRHLAQDPMLSGDLVGLAAPACKDAVEVQHAYDLPLALRRAFALCTQPPAGPVFLSLPMDLLAEETDVTVPAASRRAPLGAPEDLSAAADMLAAAQRPAIVAGDGVGRAGAVPELVAMAERLGAAVFHQPMNDGIDFPQNHALYAGMLAPTATGIREALAPHDVIVIVGCHAFMAHHYTPGSPIPDGARVVQIDDDAAEIGRNFTVEAGLVGSLSASLSAVAKTLEGRVPEADDRIEQLGVAHRVRRRATDTEAHRSYSDVPLAPLAAAHAVARGLPEDAVVVEEAITVGLELRRVLRQDRPRSYVHTVGGALGWGIGAAVGSRMGDPSRPVVAVLGDGCAAFGLQGLWSAAHYQVPVAFVVMDNSEYRTLKQTVDADRDSADTGGGYVGLDIRSPGIDWPSAARTFGVASHTVASADELVEVIATVGELDGPLLIHVPVQDHASSTSVSS